MHDTCWESCHTTRRNSGGTPTISLAFGREEVKGCSGSFIITWSPTFICTLKQSSPQIHGNPPSHPTVSGGASQHAIQVFTLFATRGKYLAKDKKYNTFSAQCYATLYITFVMGTYPGRQSPHTASALAVPALSWILFFLLHWVCIVQGDMPRRLENVPGAHTRQPTPAPVPKPHTWHRRGDQLRIPMETSNTHNLWATTIKTTLPNMHNAPILLF